MSSLALTLDTDLHARVLGAARRLDHQIPVFGVRFKVSISNVHFLAPDNIFESMPTAFVRQLAVPMRNYANQETAYQHSCHILSTINLLHPHVILQTAPEIASTLRCLSQHYAANGGLINSVWVEIRLDIKFCYWYAAALDWVLIGTGQREGESLDMETMQLQQPVVSGESSSSDELEEFLRRSSAQTWDSSAQCAICLQCLGGDEEEKGMEEEEEEVTVISLPRCSHLFHKGCIRKWFEVSETCPLCRRSFNISWVV